MKSEMHIHTHTVGKYSRYGGDKIKEMCWFTPNGFLRIYPKN